jgi:hypothetical protein
MKQERFTQLWGILTILQFMVYVVCFTPLMKLGYNPATPWPVVNTILIDYLGIGMWVVFHYAFEKLKDIAWLRILACLISLVLASGILYLNIRAFIA